MADKKTYVVMGLGVFGSTLAKDLSDYGQDVIAIDKNMEAVERLAERVNNVVCLDFTDEDQLLKAGVDEADVGIVSTGSLLEESILGIINLRSLGVKQIIAKAKNRRYAEVLKKVGADRIVMPEKEIAKRYAKHLVSDDILELYDIDSDHSMFDMVVKKGWIGKTLIDLNLRARHNLNVIGVRRDGALMIPFMPNECFKEGDVVLVISDNEVFKKIDKIGGKE